MIIAIDGPAGAGKSTIAKIVASNLGFLYIDTGAMYRALTLKVIEQNIDFRDKTSVIGLANNTNIDLKSNSEGILKVILDGKDVSGLIREPRITKLVSDIAKIKEVRRAMLGLQRNLGRSGSSVLDGRDIADKKFYLDARLEERARRRHKELEDSGLAISPEDVAKDIKNRDTIDSTREVAPLKKADDAIYIDTTDMTIEEVVKKVLSYIHQNG
jgi:cytidylate kinase